MTIQIGPWTQGEIPEDLEYQFKYKDEDGVEHVVPLPAGWEAVFVVMPATAEEAATLTASVDHDTNTVKVSFVGQAEVLASVDSFTGQFWAMNATHRIASEDYEWETNPAVGGIIPDLVTGP